MLSKLHLKKQILFSLFFLSLVLSAEGQTQKVLSGKVIDESNGEALPYAHLYFKSGRGFTADKEGNYSIPFRKTDSLFISYVGYKNRSIYLDKAGEKDIAMTPLKLEIKTVEISEENDLLYQLVARSRRTEAEYYHFAKAYYHLNSMLNGKSIEMIEAYYNAQIKGYEIQDLKLKNGRIGLKAFQDQYFISKEPSKAVLLSPAMGDSELFPTSPLGKNKRKLKKEFKLSYLNRYQDEEQRLIYELGFEPIGSKKRAFSGKLWIDSLTADVIQLEYEIDSAIRHPFLPLFPNSSIEKVDLSIRKTFLSLESRSYLERMDFNYKIDLLNRNDSLLKVEAEAIFFAYDYKNSFSLPFYRFPINLSDDYRKINALPYNEAFWENREFQLSDSKGNIESFFKHPQTVRSKQLTFEKGGEQKQFFEYPYVVWSGKRIRMRPARLPEKNGRELEAYILADRYNIAVQLYMDLNRFQDSLQIKTAAIFDPFESYYYFEQDATSAVFINLYFDLAEIYRRKMEENLRGVDQESRAKEIYLKYDKEFRSMSKSYLDEVQRGNQIERLRDWNDYINQELGIDNIKIFRLEEELSKPTKN